MFTCTGTTVGMRNRRGLEFRNLNIAFFPAQKNKPQKSKDKILELCL
jgi:hypothetical protein